MIALDRGTTALEPFAAIVFACLDHAVANEAAIRNGDAEGIHQTRIGLRRLRAVISVFKDMQHGSETDSIKTELKWLTKQFGRARDFEVVIEERVWPLEKTAPMVGEIDVLERDLETRRRNAFNRAQAVVDGERYRRIGVTTALWAADEKWSRSKNALIVARRERPAADFAAEALAERSKAIGKKIGRRRELDVRGWHKLCVAVRKLRYACEFFAGLFSGDKSVGRRPRFEEALKEIQSALGSLNDIEVHQRVGTVIVHPRKPPKKQARKAFAIDFIEGRGAPAAGPRGVLMGMRRGLAPPRLGDLIGSRRSGFLPGSDSRSSLAMPRENCSGSLKFPKDRDARQMTPSAPSRTRQKHARPGLNQAIMD